MVPSVKKENVEEQFQIQRVDLQKEMILQQLRDRGCRITKQRRTILDIILNEECASCKEIYYKAAARDSSIGTATVYRMVNILEEIGVISRRNMYKIACSPECSLKDACLIELDDGSAVNLDGRRWNKVVEAGLRACGFLPDQRKIASVNVRSCDYAV